MNDATTREPLVEEASPSLADIITHVQGQSRRELFLHWRSLSTDTVLPESDRLRYRLCIAHELGTLGFVLQYLALPYYGLEALMLRRLVRWHGRGEEHQFDYFRCLSCGRIVTHKAIRKGGCSCNLGYKVSPAILTRWEKSRLLLFPWWGVAR